MRGDKSKPAGTAAYAEGTVEVFEGTAEYAEGTVEVSEGRLAGIHFLSFKRSE